jgi:electron transfer flavoprotein beta subunit
VPDTATKIKIAADAKAIDAKDVGYITSPYDEYAVENALQIKDKNANVEVVVVSSGPADTESVLRNCLAMGADRGILLESKGDLSDPFVIASALSKSVADEKPDLLLFGIKAVDDDNAQVGGMLATMLQMPFIDGAISCAISDKTIKAKTEAEGGHQILQAAMPCAVALNKGDVEPRIASLINVRKARQKEIKKVVATLPAPSFQVEKLELPPARKGGKIVGKGVDAVPELFRLLREEAKVL